MCRRDQVDVMRPPLLKREHLVGQIIGRQCPGADFLCALADLEVLAIDAPQVAVREEDRSRPPRPRYGGLLSKMQPAVRNYDFVCGPAETRLSASAVHPAGARADVARRKMALHRQCALSDISIQKHLGGPPLGVRLRSSQRPDPDYSPALARAQIPASSARADFPWTIGPGFPPRSRDNSRRRWQHRLPLAHRRWTNQPVSGIIDPTVVHSSSLW